MGPTKKKTPYSQPKVNDFISLLTEEDSIVKYTTELSFKDKEKEKIAAALVNIMATNEPRKAVVVVKEWIAVESTEDPGTLSISVDGISHSRCKEFALTDSTSAKTFAAFCQTLCCDYVKHLLEPVIDELNTLDSKDELKPNSDPLMNMVNDHSLYVFKLIHIHRFRKYSATC